MFMLINADTSICALKKLSLVKNEKGEAFKTSDQEINSIVFDSAKTSLTFMNNIASNRTTVAYVQGETEGGIKAYKKVTLTSKFIKYTDPYFESVL